MKKTLLSFIALSFLIIACGGDSSSTNTKDAGTEQKKEETKSDSDDPMENKGIGEVKEVKLNSPLDAEMVAGGKGIYELKCAACHKLTDQRVVGPGWKNITTRRSPEWIMNMTLNVDVMLEKDPIANQQLKECLVRMPNQNLSKEEARSVLEFMYSNDGQEVGG